MESTWHNGGSSLPAHALTKIKIPAAIHVLRQLPKNAVGKVDKPALQKSLSPQSA